MDTYFLEEYIREMHNCEKLMKGLLATYLVTGDYVPADMARLQEICDTLTKSNGEVMTAIGELCHEVNRVERTRRAAIAGPKPPAKKKYRRTLPGG